MGAPTENLLLGGAEIAQLSFVGHSVIGRNVRLGGRRLVASPVVAAHSVVIRNC